MDILNFLGFLLNMIFMGIVIYGYLEGKVPSIVAIFWGIGHLCLAQFFLWNFLDIVLETGAA